MTVQLVRYEAARSALRAAHSVDEVKEIRDKAEAMAAYARQAKDTALVQWATEIKVRAERKAGEMLRATAESGERDQGRGGDRKSQSHDATVKLSDLGISRDQSSRWQQVASIPEEHFEAAVNMAKNSAGEVTTAFLLREAKKGKPKGKPKKGKAAQERMRQLDEAQKESMLANYLHIVFRIVKSKQQFTESETALMRDLQKLLGEKL